MRRTCTTGALRTPDQIALMFELGTTNWPKRRCL